MIAKLWANQIISGKKDLDEVPLKLKEEVKKILTEMGYENGEVEMPRKPINDSYKQKLKEAF